MRRFLRDESGATAIEYVLVATIVSIVIVAGAAAIGQHVRVAFFDNVAAGFTTGR